MKKIILALSILINSALFAQEITEDDVKYIIRTTAAADGFLTQKMHDDFWSFYRNQKNSGERDRVFKSIRTALIPAQKMQMEFWRSAKMSYESGKVVKTDNLKKFMKDIRALIPRSEFNYLSDEEYKYLLVNFEASTKHKIATYDSLLEKIAKKQPIKNGVAIDKDIIDQTLGGVEGGFYRIDLLLTEDAKVDE